MSIYKYLFLFFIFSVTHYPCQAEENIQSILTDPSFSNRCDDLLEKRNKKIVHKNKILSLIDRNRRLRKTVASNKITIKNNLEKNFSDLRRELYLTRQKITFADEEIIRKGCPGIVL